MPGSCVPRSRVVAKKLKLDHMRRLRVGEISVEFEPAWLLNIAWLSLICLDVPAREGFVKIILE